MINTNLKELDKTLTDDVLVILIMSASWCGPCKIVHPILEEISEEYKDKLIMFDCDVDENLELSSKYNIKNIPTVLFFKNKQLVDKQVGVMSKTSFLKTIDKILKIKIN
jgi:thioredoxin 1